MKFFTCMYRDKHFDLFNLQSSAQKVKINQSDVIYGDAKVVPVTMNALNNDEYTELAKTKANHLTLWEQFKIAFIWQNPDDTFWLDSLSETFDEAFKFMSESSRSRLTSLGFKVVPVQFQFSSQETLETT